MARKFFVSGPHNILFASGVIGCLLFLQALCQQLFLAYDFKILAIATSCQQPLNNRCVYQYSVIYKDGTQSNIELPGDVFRQEELAVGSAIKKGQFTFEYEVDGKQVTWAFAGTYLVVLFASLCSFGLWRYLTPTDAAPNFSPS